MSEDKVLSQSQLKQPSNIWGQGISHPLRPIFSPQNVAVVGASEQTASVGRTLVWNLISNPFGGTVFPINPKRSQILGLKTYAKLADLPEPVDLAVIATPAATVPDILGECVEAGVRGAIVISAGFREIGEEGVRLEEKALQQAKRGNMRLIGPNCLGVINPILGLNATFARAMAKPGNVGFLSQSGALCTAVLDWSLRENVGFSAFVSLGSMLDVGWGDLITYLGDDPHTKSILIYMESVGDARAFLSAAREVALTKPIIVIKAGRTEAAAKAAATHTGSLAGSDEVLDAAFRRSGVLRVKSISDLFYMAEVLGKQPRPEGPRLTVLTNAGGPGVLATDSLIMQGGELAVLSEESLNLMNEFLPAQWSHGNPIDLLGDADPQRYQKAFRLAAGDKNTDGLLVILTPQSMTQPTEVAQELIEAAKDSKKPILASWMGGDGVAEGEDKLNEAMIPTFGYPDTAARMFAYMWRYSSNLRSLYETPIAVDESQDATIGREEALQLLNSVRESNRTVLTEFESKKLLAAYGIPCIDTYIAKDVEQALQIAKQIGYPVVLKLHSETITHKTDVNGVQLNLQNGNHIRDAYHLIRSSVEEKVGADHFHGVTVQPMIQWAGYELIIGSTFDPQFGPVLLFGSGGQLVEVFKDRALALPPLTTTLAERMMERTHIYTALQGVRGRDPVNLLALQQLLVRFSQLIAEQRWIKEIEINPLLASADQLIAVDARAILHHPDVSEDQLPNLAIRPYPIEYVSAWNLGDGTPIIIRPIRPDDEPLIVKFHELLSDRSVYLRYLHPVSLDSRITHERLTRICFNDYDREIALVAHHKNLEENVNEIMGVCRLIKAYGSTTAEFALLVADPFQGKGLGTKLLESVVEVASKEGIGHMHGDILPENRHMQELLKKVGFRLEFDAQDKLLRASIDLR